MNAQFAKAIVFCGGIAVAVLLAAAPPQAHKLVTSKYTYTEDVYPLVSERCGSCHVPGGIAPMSLLTYKDAVPWAESMRAELVSRHMPPWFADSGYAEMKDSHNLTPRELDILLTWATGGTPQGPVKKLPPPALRNTWRIARPDLALALPEEFTLAADKMEDTHEFVVQAASDRDRWVRLADLLPGTPAMVHDAAIYTKASDGAENVLALWVPGIAPVAAPNGSGFRWPSGADLAVRIHYKKTWKYEGKPLTDRSTVGVYLLKTVPARELRSVEIRRPSVVLDEDVQAFAVHTDAAPSDVGVRVDAVRPDGGHVPIVALTTRAGWDQRYWLEHPVLLPRGTHVNVEASSSEGDRKSPSEAVKLWIDVASNQKAATATPDQ